jgi:hypothetical protein
VCTVLPSFHKTPLLQAGAGSIDAAWAAAPAETRSGYGDGFGRAAKVGGGGSAQIEHTARSERIRARPGIHLADTSRFRPACVPGCGYPAGGITPPHPLPPALDRCHLLMA